MYEPHDDNILSLREILGFLFLRKWVILVVFLATVAGAAGVTFWLLSPEYEASAKILFNPSELTVPQMNAPPATDIEKETLFNSQKEVLKSAETIEAIVDELGLATGRKIGRVEQVVLWVKGKRLALAEWLDLPFWRKPVDPRAMSILAVTNSLKVTATPDTRVLKVTYQAFDPKEAADTLALIIRKYDDYYTKFVNQQASGATSYLESQLLEVQAKLEKAEATLLEAQKAKLKGDTAGAKVSGKNGRGKDKPVSSAALDVALSIADVADNPAVQEQLKINIMAMEKELREIESEFANDHPRVMKLQRDLQRYTTVLEAIPDREHVLRQVKREVDVYQDTYLHVRKNLEKARAVQSGNTDNMDMVTVLEAARADDSPVKPKRKVILGLAMLGGLMLGLVVGIVVDYMDHTVRRARDVTGYLGVPLLGYLPKL